jgi:hypothetical protein
MPTELTTKAIERSTYVVTVAFTDENDSAMTPNEVTWSLRDGQGKIVNGRSNVSLTPATSVDIVLQGADLEIGAGEDDGLRWLTVEGTYDSVAGSGLPFRDEAVFRICDLRGVS